MFQPEPSTVLDKLAEKYNFTHRDYIVAEKFVSASRMKRDVFEDFIIELAQGMLAEKISTDTFSFLLVI